MSFETLESRRLFTGITHTGTLVIDGSDHADDITLVRVGANVVLIATLGSGMRVDARFPVNEVKRILVEAKAGNDVVKLMSSLNERATVLGGGGNDDLSGNYGATLIGGSGNDRLTGIARTNYDVKTRQFADADVPQLPSLLSGGLGDDTLIADRDDNIVGGKGADTLGLSARYTGIGEGQSIDVSFEGIALNDIFGDNPSGIETFAQFPVISGTMTVGEPS